MSNIIIDSNLLVALIDEKDKWNTQAITIKIQLQKQEWSIIYFDCIINETASTLAKRLQEKKRAAEFPLFMAKLQKLAPKQNITWVYPRIKQFYYDIITLMTNHHGRLNFHDALIALAARNLGISYIASFDKDFDEISWLTRMKDEKNFKRTDPAQ